MIVKIRHVLILIIISFMLYHFMNRCRCFDNGFQVGGQKDMCDSLYNDDCRSKNYGYYCEGIDFSDCVLETTNLNLNDANLNNTTFDTLDLSDSNFSDAKLQAANFKGSTLIGTNFQGANLTSAYFIESILDNASFNGANLEKAMFEGVDEEIKLPLNGVNFTDAIFEDTIFYNVIFGESVKLGDNIIDSTCGNVEFRGELDNKYECKNGQIKKK